MQKKLRLLSALLAATLMMAGCSEESKPEHDTQNFTAIFDNNKFNASYSPIDLVQTPDGGYLVLGSRRLADSNFSGTYLLKADKFGNFVKELEVEESALNPIGRFVSYQDKYYFICMTAGTQQAQIAEVDAGLEAITMKPVNGGGITYPSAAAFVDNTFILLSYNNDSKESIISLVNLEGGVLASKGFGIGAGDDVEEPIINHFLRTGRKFPFEVGKVSNGLYFFNGFYNYTFSLVFTNLTSDEPIGVVQGQQDDGGFSAVVPLGATKFATSRYNFGDNYLLPNVTLPTNSTTSGVDLGGYNFPELVPNAKVKILRTTASDKNVLIYGCDTKSKQIGLLFYDEASGVFISSRYLGFSNPFEIANLIQTADGGIAVCGTTYIAGRFPRICIFKLSEDKIADSAK